MEIGWRLRRWWRRIDGCEHDATVAHCAEVGSGVQCRAKGGNVIAQARAQLCDRGLVKGVHAEDHDAIGDDKSCAGIVALSARDRDHVWVHVFNIEQASTKATRCVRHVGDHGIG